MDSILWQAFSAGGNKPSLTTGRGDLLTPTCAAVWRSRGLAVSAFVHMVFLWREKSPAAALRFFTGDQTTDFLEKARRSAQTGSSQMGRGATHRMTFNDL